MQKSASTTKKTRTLKTASTISKTAFKKLIITEKPSVASDIAKVIGTFTKKKDYYENEEYLIAYSIGHLLKLAMPNDLGEKGWSFNNLPIIPDVFQLVPIESTEHHLKTLIRLIKLKEVDEIINACDAGREGELIFREILSYSKVEKKTSRLWLQSMTPQAIIEGFKKLKQEQEMEGLASAANCRSESDWLIGINTTRALTAFNSKNGGFFLTTAGRVQTPTLSILVTREKERFAFNAQDYYEILLDVQAEAGLFTSKWYDPHFSGDVASGEKATRLFELAKAEKIKQKVSGKTAIFKETKKASKQTAPLLFDLTSLQRESSNKFGYSANRTLQVAQSLYERYKLITYPRTDSKFLPEDYLKTVKDTISSLKETALGSFCNRILENRWVFLNKRIFDNTKVSDHFALIPTGQNPSNLAEAEQKVFDLIFKRFLAAFFPSAEYEITSRMTVVEGESFKTDGKILLIPGWLEVYGKSQEEEAELPALKEGEKTKITQVTMTQSQTTPPARYTEATLLSAMEGAEKLVEDEDLKEALKERGLGTPATRAAIIEGLISEGYIIREGRELIPTAKGIQLYETLLTLKVEVITSPELTGEWEYRLKQMESSKYTREKFMSEIVNLTQSVVSKIKNFNEEEVSKGLGFLDPVDGSEVCETLKAYVSQKGRFVCKKIMGNRKLEPRELEELLIKGFIGPLSGFLSKSKKPFSAGLKFENGKVELKFDNTDTEDPERFLKLKVLGKLKDNSTVYEDTLSYVSDNPKSQFRLPKTLLNRSIPPEQIVKILNTGRSDLLEGFRSKRTKRLFSAYLTLDSKNNIVFEFASKKQSTSVKE